MAETQPAHQQTRITSHSRPDVDLVRHHYNRRALWGDDTVLYRKTHPMELTSADGTYQNWEIDTTDLVPADAQAAAGEPARLFFSDDMTVWVSRRRETMPYFV